MTGNSTGKFQDGKFRSNAGFFPCCNRVFGTDNRNQGAVNQKTERRRRIPRGCFGGLCRWKDRPCKSPYRVTKMGGREGVGVPLSL